MDKLPSPEEIGLPAKFGKWRSNQEEALSVIITSRKRSTAVCAPTGMGKSAIAVASALMSEKPTCIVTGSRGLQSQYTDDFGSIGMVDVRGRANYTCVGRIDSNCEEGALSKCIYQGSMACPSSAAEIKANSSKLVVTNYSKWTHMRNSEEGLKHIEQVIFDEGHELPSAVAGAMQVVLYREGIEKTLGKTFPKYPKDNDMDVWKLWFASAIDKADWERKKAVERVMLSASPRQAWVKDVIYLRNLCMDLSVLCAMNPRDWVVEEIDGDYQFDPIRPGRYAESAMLCKVPRVVVLSATLRPKTMFMAGISHLNFDFYEFDSDFDPARCPIYWVPTMRVDARATDLSPLWNQFDRIAAKRQDRKGIVHTVSYNRRDELVARSRFSGKMIVNPKGEPPTEVVDRFKKSGPGHILVSPSINTGYDFDGDSCRWQFMCKIPFEPPSKVQKARQEDDKEYRAYRAMQYLVQAFGRDMRSKNDWSERFLCDDHIQWFKAKYAHLAPRSFHNFFREVEVVPQPPSLESMRSK